MIERRVQLMETISTSNDGLNFYAVNRSHQILQPSAMPYANSLHRNLFAQQRASRPGE